MVELAEVIQAFSFKRINSMKPLYKKLTALGLTGAVALSGAYLIAPSEGYVEGVYVDPVGIVTSCYGHTGPDIKLGQKLSEQDCVRQFAKDLDKHNKELTAMVKVSFQSDYQHAALLSFCYNVGSTNCKNSSLLRKLNAGNHVGVCSSITKWVYAQKKDCRIKANNCFGIVTRRAEEYKWCMGEVIIEDYEKTK